MYLVYTRYIPDIYFGVYVGIYQVYTRYIPGLEITRYIPGIYLVYTSYIADVGLYPVYTRYIPGKFHFYRFQMKFRSWRSEVQSNFFGSNKARPAPSRRLGPSPGDSEAVQLRPTALGLGT